MIKIAFGISITYVAYKISMYLKARFKTPVLNPVMIGALIIIAELKAFNLTYEDYQGGGDAITFFLTPLIILLAVPLYKNKKILKENAVPILMGVMSSIIASGLSIVVLSKIFGIDKIIMLTLLPKSITTPIAIEASRLLMGIPSLTIFSVIVTGIGGAVVAPYVIRYGKIESNIAKGIAIGASSHAIGTSQAMEMGDEIGAASSLAMGVTGMITILIISVTKILF